MRGQTRTWVVMALVALRPVYLSLEGRELLQVGFELLGVVLRGGQLCPPLQEGVAQAFLGFFQLLDADAALLGGLGDRRDHPGALCLVSQRTEGRRALLSLLCTQFGRIPRGDKNGPCPWELGAG